MSNIYMCSSSNFNPTKGKLILIYAENEEACGKLLEAEVALRKFPEIEWNVAMIGYGDTLTIVTVLREK